jgi:AbrB family looped-hinge helix DNA binding protein
MALAKVLLRGRITIPREVREAVRLAPGDTVQVQVTGPDTIRLTVLPRRPLEEWIARYRVAGPVDYGEAVKQGEDDAAAEVIARIEQDRRERSERST